MKIMRLCRNAGILTLFFALVQLSAAASAWAQAAEESGQGEKLSIISVLESTYKTNPTLQAARAELKAVQEQLDQAAAGWKPTVEAKTSVETVDINSDPDSTADGSTAKEAELSVSEPLWRGGRTTAAIRAARNIITAQQASLLNTQQNVLLDAATAYMDVVRDASLLDLSQSNIDVIGKQLKASKDRFAVGEITKTDVSQSESRLARAQADVIAARAQLNKSRATYEQVTGLPVQDLPEPAVSFPLPASYDDALFAADQNSPGVLMARYTYRAAQDNTDEAFGKLLPEVGLFGNVNKTWDPSPGLLDEETVSTVGISATIPLYQAGTARSKLREARHTADRRFVQIDEARRSARENVIGAWENLEAAKAEIVSRQAQVDASTVATEGVHSEAAVGSRTILDALDSDQELLDARAALVTAKRDEIVARFALGAALGLLTPENLGFPASGQN